MNINNLDLIPSTGRNDNSFVGLKVFNNRIEFHYPETYFLNVDDKYILRKQILDILKTISLVKTKSKDPIQYFSKHLESNELPFRSFVWIINDYLVKHGYENKEKVYSFNSNGKINWKKTLNYDPIISDSNVIYSKLVTQKKYQRDNIITEAYNCCVSYAIDNVGWLFGIYDIVFENYKQMISNKKMKYLFAINDEISHTFDDSKKIRLNHMRNIICGLDDSLINSNELVYGVDSYETVFEKMVDKMFSNVETLKEFYPNGTWDLVLENESVNSSNLRPDTVLIKEKNVYILDSKYYRYGTTFDIKDLPETTSIQKQITYGEYIKQVKAGIYNNVYNAFIIPYNCKNNIESDKFNDYIEFVGIATAKWYDNSTNETNRKIVAILIDLKHLIDNYVYKNENDTTKLINLIINKTS